MRSMFLVIVMLAAFSCVAFGALPLFHEAISQYHKEGKRRKLISVCVGPTKNYYFEVTIRLVPNNQTDTCTVADQVFLGNDLNLLLFNYGVGDIGLDNSLFQSTVFVAAVCPLPTTSTSRRQLQYSPTAFVWIGGGGCRFCLKDNKDQRRVLRGTVNGTAMRELQTVLTPPSDWFADVYAPETALAIEAAILQQIVPNHGACLGLFPTVDVRLEEISLADLNLGCDDGTIIESLLSLNLADAPLKSKVCGTCKSIDFSKKGNKVKLEKGAYVQNEWKVEDGLVISASGGYAPGFKARIFDTTDAECIALDGTLDFGSPNKGCSGGGIGEGGGGTSGAAGENCKPVGNVLIIQDSNKDCPDASKNGGSLKFAWNDPILVSDIGLMDIDEQNQRLKFKYADGFVETFTYKGFGNNAVQRVIANKINVVELEVVLTGTGAVTEINFCSACVGANNPVEHDVDHHCLYDVNAVLSKAETVIGYDDFEDSSSFNGWTNGKLEDLEQGSFTKFLGRYAKNMNSPFKTYNVPSSAQSITVSIDFYEIDGWDMGQDTAQVFVNGDLIELGSFSAYSDEGHREGSTTAGLHWVLDSIAPPSNLGFNKTRMDQKHHVEIDIPQESGLYADGRLRLTLDAYITDNVDRESAGWDNVKLVGQFGCQEQEEVVAKTTCETIEHFEDFEGSNVLAGWFHGKLEVGEQSAFTKFLGRYGNGDLSPVKVFSVPSTALKIMVQVDFYEIDSWDGGLDTAAILVDGETVGLGAFAHWEDEGHRFGTTNSGLFWQLDSLTAPAQMGFLNDQYGLDQKHRLTIEIPKTSGMFNDGKISVRLMVSLSSSSIDESGGWDNIKITSQGNCVPAMSSTVVTTASTTTTTTPTTTTTTTTTVATTTTTTTKTSTLPLPSCQSIPWTTQCFEDFEGFNSLAGWSNGKLETGGQSGFTKFLGRYANGDSSPSKVFVVPSTAKVLLFEVDFYEIDSWDGSPDTAAIYIDGEKIELGSFAQWIDEGNRSGTTPSGMIWHLKSLSGISQLGFWNGQYGADQKHQVTIEIPKSSGLFDDGNLLVKLVVNLNSAVNDESGGWDNIKIASKSNCS